ncbi:MAG: fatty acid desaturase family protein [Pseudomonadota bacterium]
MALKSSPTWGAQYPYISNLEMKQLSKITPWRTTAALVFDWAAIFISAWAAQESGAWWAYACAIVVIAGRLHALAGLVHDFAHYHYIKNKKRSDLIGNIFAAWPLLITVESYRNNHLAHHRHTNLDKDPDWQAKLGVKKFTFPMAPGAAIRLFLSYFVGIGALDDMRSALKRIHVAADKPALTEKLLRIGFYSLVVGAITALGLWQQVLFFWVLPFFTLFFFFMYVRSVAEHFGSSMDHGHELGASRTVLPAWWEGWLFSPHNLNYHLDHHLYPTVPFYRLKALHKALMTNPNYASQAHITHGYMRGLLGELGVIKPSQHPLPAQ